MTAPVPPRAVASAALLTACLAAFLAATTVAAHPDVPLVEGRVEVDAGAVLEVPAALHYHRIVGRYHLVEGVPSQVALELVGDDAGSDAPAGSAPAPGPSDGADRWVLATGDGDGRIDRLVPCCLGSTFSPFRLVVRNEGATPAILDLRAWAVHDDLAVVAHRAEGGAFEFPAAVVLALVTATAVAVVRSRRAGRARVDAGEAATRPGRSPADRVLAWSAAAFLVAAVSAGVLATVGMVRYGAGPVAGIVAAMADLPVPAGPFGSRVALVMGVLLLVWATSVTVWIRAVRLDVPVRSPRVAAVGATYGAVAIAVGAALSATYGGWVPVALGLLYGVPTLLAAGVLGAAARGRSGATTATGGSGAAG